MKPGKRMRNAIVGVIGLGLLTAPQTGSATIGVPQAPTSTKPGGFPEKGRVAFQRVFFDADGSATRIALFAMAPGDFSAERLTDPPKGVETGRVDWAPDGRRIAYMRLELEEPRHPAIFVARRNGTDRTNLSAGHCPTDACQGEEDPAWSPGADRIAFVRTIDGTRSLFVMRPNGTHRRQVVAPPSDRFEDLAPAWSPDGTRLVFRRFDFIRDRAALFIVHVDGTGSRRITGWRLDGLNRPDWSPDGRRIVFEKLTRSGSTQLCLIHPNGAGIEQITHSFGASWVWAAFSPDGSMLAAVRSPGERSENDIYVMELDGSDIRPLTDPLSRRPAEGLPDWLPDPPQAERISAG